MPDKSVFHWQNGWFFQRKHDGSVRIEKRSDPPASNQEGELEALAEIPAEEWASIVAHVSQFGDDAPHWRLALEFHGKED